MRIRSWNLVAVLGVWTASAWADCHPDCERFITIGTGGVTGVYYPAGGAICRLINGSTSEHGIKCAVESTGGSVYNVNIIRQGELDMGIVQSDIQYDAYYGQGQAFEEQGPLEELRAVFSLQPEVFTVVARADADIETFDDLQGKRVNIGNPGSSQRFAMERLMERKGWTVDDFALASELRSAEQSEALSDNNVDAIVFTVGHPSSAVQEVTAMTDAVIVPVTGSEVDQLVEEIPYYSKATIPGGMYRGVEEEIETFGVRATFVASAEVPEYVVYEVVKAVFEGFDSFKDLHPAFANLNKEEMASEALSAPLHPGAARYYREAGLL